MARRRLCWRPTRIVRPCSEGSTGGTKNGAGDLRSPTGAIEGVLCRGQIEIKRLRWDRGRIELTLISHPEQSILLEAPSDIRRISVTGGEASVRRAEEPDSRRLSLPAGRDVTLSMDLR